MRQQQLEARVLHLVDIVMTGRRVEDDRVEFKAAWPPDHRNAARQIAGLANAAGGEPIVWIIGVDEDAHRLADPGEVEPANWWAATARGFAELAPDVSILTVPTPHGGPVVALQWETGRAPYVVKTDGRGQVDREIPWRQMNATRSAHRSEILRSLVGEAQVPQLECISAALRIERGAGHGEDAFDDGLVSARLWIAVYVEAIEPARLPEHKWQFGLDVAGLNLDLTCAIEGPTVPTGSSPSGGTRLQSVGSISYVPSSGLHVNGSDRIDIHTVRANAFPDPDGQFAELFRAAKRVTVAIHLPLANSSRAARLDFVVPRRAKSEMNSLGVPSVENVDRRLGEFTFGSNTWRWWRYSGHRRPKSSPLAE